MPKRIVIVDPSLKDARGHHYALSRRITESVVNEGFDPIWLCHKDASFADTGGAHIEPALSVSLYDAYHRSRFHHAIPRRLRRPAQKLHGAIRASWRRRGFSTRPSSAHEQLAADLGRAIDVLGLSSEDRLLFHTADGQTYAAIDLLLRARSVELLPKLYLCTPYDSAGIMPNRVAELPISECIDRWRDAGWLASHIYLFAENQTLAEHLSAIWRATVLPLELPAVRVDPDPIEEPGWPGERSADPLKIVHLGPARAEKGFHLLPDIIGACLTSLDEAGRRRDKVSFVIQCSPQIIGYTPPIAKAIDQLRQFPGDLVHLLDQTLDDASYLNWLTSSDLVLLPYGVREYQKRSSGVVTEALSFGKIIVATAATYPASMIRPGAGGTGVTPSELGQRIADIAEDPDTFRANAAEASRLYHARNDPKLYIGKCLQAERELAR